jgi:hypothetical protein
MGAMEKVAETGSFENSSYKYEGSDWTSAYKSVVSALETSFHTSPRPTTRYTYQALTGKTKIRLLYLYGPQPAPQDDGRRLAAERGWIVDIIDQFYREQTGQDLPSFDYDRAAARIREGPASQTTGVDPLLSAAADQNIWKLEEADITQHPKFEALSYSWMTSSGDSNKEWPIILDGKSVLYVTRNLWQALHRLRPKTGVRVLWADQICINQEDIPERNYQLEIMKDIFESARKTILWLGEDDEACKQVGIFLKEMDMYERFIATKSKQVR